MLSVPALSLRRCLAAWAPHIPPQTVIVSLMKGIETGSALRASEIIREVTGVPAERVAVLSGPNLAREIMARQPAAATIACPDEDAAQAFQAACHTPYFRPYTSTDVIGCEMGGALKNVIALAVGIATGMGPGHNATALIMTRGLAESTRLATALGAEPGSLAGLSGMGDLVATCSSPLSRNRSFGTPPRSRPERRRGRRRDPADHRGCQERRGDPRPRPRPRPRRRHADHDRGHRRAARQSHPRRGRRRPDAAATQARIAAPTTFTPSASSTAPSSPCGSSSLSDRAAGSPWNKNPTRSTGLAA
ncbi:glycerol-3-phosphate dehydrogenase [Streptomyces bottropensis ATCC 25435]|uniref:Glycerol-3-phosphate dehydrogenase n=1 Tax=Streptomyces bottropensis ATCC 25435 TaxID=1054862 RepID=M3FUW4_9ACTN|nr:glycerol-3-phosphate dehydrogenase [Streptomyces bottropensis ATCC 25435]